jgi:EAL domain-containing protein (putative c-di-GMP-specific phosphodiesterase class I)
VQAIVQLGQTLRKAIVAEGIESEAQSLLLQRLGCTVGQGFHLGRPLSALAARAWLQSHPAGGALQ